MNNKSKFLMTTGAVALGITTGTIANDADAKEGFEKCYGVVKAAKNDCGAADGSHSCAGMAASDASGQEWLYVPKGTCEKLTGGSKTAK